MVLGLCPPLPALVSRQSYDTAAVISAYNIILQLEKKLLAEIDSATSKRARETQQALMHCRIVGHFFHHVPTDKGLNNVVKQVGSTGGDEEKLVAIGKLYYEQCIQLCKFIPCLVLRHTPSFLNK